MTPPQASEAAVGGWQSIESAPKDGSFVLLYDDRFKHSHHSYLMAQYDGGIWWGVKTQSGRAIIWHDATHWSPLPPPPLQATP